MLLQLTLLALQITLIKVQVQQSSLRLHLAHLSTSSTLLLVNQRQVQALLGKIVQQVVNSFKTTEYNLTKHQDNGLILHKESLLNHTT